MKKDLKKVQIDWEQLLSLKNEINSQIDTKKDRINKYSED